MATLPQFSWHCSWGAAHLSTLPPTKVGSLNRTEVSVVNQMLQRGVTGSQAAQLAPSTPQLIEFVYFF
jgi:hypothetical protein